MKQRINKVLFLGSKEIGLIALKTIHALSPGSLMGIITFDDSTDSRTQLVAIKAFAQTANVPLFVVKGNKEAEGVIKKLKPQLCFVTCWYWLISESVLKAVPHGFIILHNSLLPKYRGAAPLVWAIINGETQIGFSLFTATQGVDEGPVWAQGAIRITASDYIADVLKKLEPKIIHVLTRAYPAILKGTIKPKEQKRMHATYGAPRKPADGNINWGKSARHVYNFIRAQSDPFPGAFTYCGASPMKVWRAKLHDACYYGTPGQVAGISPEGVIVVCGDNRAIILQSVEINAQRQPPQDFIRSIKTRFSDRASLS